MLHCIEKNAAIPSEGARHHALPELKSETCSIAEPRCARRCHLCASPARAQLFLRNVHTSLIVLYPTIIIKYYSLYVVDLFTVPCALHKGAALQSGPCRCLVIFFFCLTLLFNPFKSLGSAMTRPLQQCNLALCFFI